MMRQFKYAILFLIISVYSNLAPACGPEPLLGEICWVAFDFAPTGYALCDGRLLSINSNSALFSLIGTTYGGNGVTDFALPNLQGQVAVGRGSAPSGTNYTLGQIGGSETIGSSLITYLRDYGTTQRNGRSNDSPDTNKDLVSAVIQNSVTPTPASNLQPYMTLTCIIAIEGIFPSRP